MGAVCSLYKKNKRICQHCGIKYCGHCLIEKHRWIRHEHKSNCCSVYIELDVKYHKCKCTYCDVYITKDMYSPKTACSNCITKYNLIRCGVCGLQCNKESDHICKCKYCAKKITVRYSDNIGYYCSGCDPKLCKWLIKNNKDFCECANCYDCIIRDIEKRKQNDEEYWRQMQNAFLL